MTTFNNISQMTGRRDGAQWRNLDDMSDAEQVDVLARMVAFLEMAVKATQEGKGAEFQAAVNRVIEQRQDEVRQSVPDFTSTALKQAEGVLR